MNGAKPGRTNCCHTSRRTAARGMHCVLTSSTWQSCMVIGSQRGTLIQNTTWTLGSQAVGALGAALAHWLHATGFLYYQEYLPLCITHNRDPASYPYFMYVLKMDFQKQPVSVKIVLRDESRKKKFHECPTCAGFKRELATLPAEARLAKQHIRDLRHIHYTEEVRVEKQLYYQRRGMGATTLRDPNGCLSIILDGEDQNETTFPHQPRVPENVEKTTRCKLKVEGVLVHGLVLLLYLLPPWLGSGAPMATTVLLHSIWVCKQQLHNLPQCFYLQSDNGSENKNKVQ